MNGNSVFTTQKMRDCWTNKCENFMHDDGLDLFFLIKETSVLISFSVCLRPKYCMISWSAIIQRAEAMRGQIFRAILLTTFCHIFLALQPFCHLGSTWYKMVHISSIIVQRPQNIFVKVLCITFSGLARLFCQAWKTCLSLLLFSLNAH